MLTVFFKILMLQGVPTLIVVLGGASESPIGLSFPDWRFYEPDCARIGQHIENFRTGANFFNENTIFGKVINIGNRSATRVMILKISFPSAALARVAFRVKSALFNDTS